MPKIMRKAKLYTMPYIIPCVLYIHIFFIYVDKNISGRLYVKTYSNVQLAMKFRLWGFPFSKMLNLFHSKDLLLL